MNNIKIYHKGDKVIVRLNGEHLKFGDIALVDMVDFSRSNDPYFLRCPLRAEGDWMHPSFFDKYQEKPPIIKSNHSKSTVLERMRNVVQDAPREPIIRPEAKYDNKPTYKYDENI